MSLITACAIFCSLNFHVVCTCSFFGDTICVLTNRKMIKIATLIDLHIVLTYECWHCFLVFNIWVIHALELTIDFYYPSLSYFVYRTLFSSVPTPAIDNDRSLNSLAFEVELRHVTKLAERRFYNSFSERFFPRFDLIRQEAKWPSVTASSESISVFNTSFTMCMLRTVFI
jgi:hypothetical protein